MKILCADYILTCDSEFSIIRDGAVCFDEKILDIGKKDDVIKNNPYAKVKYLSKNSCILPGLINTHLHLEFSANKATLIYGDFTNWLKSVIEKREELQKQCLESCYEDTMDEMLESGTVAFGAVSSFGADMISCFETPQRVVYFNEILGSNPDFLDENIKNFEKRLQKSLELANDSFLPGVFIHAPYSTHPMLAKYIINIAKKEDLRISTHFMESFSEREWLNNGSGKFREFLSGFTEDVEPMYSAMEYLELFEGIDTLFAHCNVADKKELAFISKNGSISHCIRSNRLLGNPMLNLKKVKELGVNLTIGTDGLSSNTSLNLWDEMRTFIYAHNEEDLLKASKDALLATTRNGAKSLRLVENGTLEIGKHADLVSVVLPDSVEDTAQLPLELILHTKSIKSGYIAGERYV